MKFRFSLILLVLILLPVLAPVTFADYKDRTASLQDHLKDIQDSMSTLSAQDQILANLQLAMLNRQIESSFAFSSVETRVKTLSITDARHDRADAALKSAEKSLNEFLALDPTQKGADGSLPFIDSDPPVIISTFLGPEKKANEAISNVNLVLLAPDRPGNVPSGDLLGDFIPGFIRFLMRFASLAVLISLITSGVFLIMTNGVEERVTKAKHMLYYSLLGFIFIALAFAMVKAVTDIDFFGFI